MTRPFVWVDAFARAPLSGNPCAVVFDADDLDEGARLAFTRETRLSECAFVVSSATADFGARYYTAAGPIPMAGHPTVATVLALADRGLIRAPARFTLELGGGALPIELDAAGRVTMRFPAPRLGPALDAERVAAIVGLDPSDLAHPPVAAALNEPKAICVLRSVDALGRARLDIGGLQAARADPEAGFDEVFLATVLSRGDAAGAPAETRARFLLAPPEPPEDSFTGAATAELVSVLWREGLIDAPRIVARQGVEMGRPSDGEAEAIGPRDAIEGVRVSGVGAIVMRGEVAL